MANPDTGIGITVTSTTYSAVWSTLGITSINIGGQDTPVIDATALADTGTRKKIFGALKDCLPITFRVHWNNLANLPSLQGAADTLTLTPAQTTAAGAAGTLAITGAVTHWGDVEFNVDEQVNECDIEFTPDGATFTWTAET